MAEGPLILLSRVPGRTFIETGLIVIRDSRNRIFAERSDWSDRDILNNIAVHHEWIHYLQSVTCAAVNFTSQEILQLSVQIIESAAQGKVSTSIHRKFRELKESLYGRRANEPLQIQDSAEKTIIIPIPDSHQIGILDLMEGVAVLESFKLCTKNARVEDFLIFRDHYFPGSPKSVYRWSFNWLANKIGLEAAYELLGPVSFFALQTVEPSDAFVNIVKKLSQEKNLDFKELVDVEVFANLFSMEEWGSWLHGFEHGEPESGHVTLDPCITHAVKQLGWKKVKQLGAMPSQVTLESSKPLLPPVQAYSGMDGVTFDVATYAATNGLVESVLDWTSAVGAAERLTIRAETDVYQFCPHRTECPHFESALCYRNYVPPGVSRSHDKCRFPNVLFQIAGLSPSDLWAKVGRKRKSVQELVEDIEATGPAGLWALIRRQRASIIAWLGRDGYNELEWKSKVVADKTIHALKTQSMQDVIESQMFHDAVVNEVRRLAHETISSNTPTSSTVRTLQELEQALSVVNIDFSEPKLLTQLDAFFSKYPQFAEGCLKLLSDNRLKKKVYFDVIFWNYTEELKGHVNFDSPDGDLNTKTLKTAMLRAYNSRNGSNASSFGDIIESR